jgi:hypothetical protein
MVGTLVHQVCCYGVDPLATQPLGERSGLPAPERRELGIAATVEQREGALGVRFGGLAVASEQDLGRPARRLVTNLTVAPPGCHGPEPQGLPQAVPTRS